MSENEFMKGVEPVEQLIDDLTGKLVPVRRLWSPWLRASLWVGAVLAIAACLAMTTDVAAMLHRLGEATDMWLAVVGSSATAILAAVAVFQLSLPDRDPRWALLPLPGAALWIGASGLGCLRHVILPGTHVASLADTRNCLVFIIGLSIPLSLVMIFMLRRAYTLRPNLTAAIGGLAVASAAATLLNFVHPFDAAATDLTVHVLAVSIVVMANRFLGGGFLSASK
jgi:hypothetical protein